MIHDISRDRIVIALQRDLGDPVRGKSVLDRIDALALSECLTVFKRSGFDHRIQIQSRNIRAGPARDQLLIVYFFYRYILQNSAAVIIKTPSYRSRSKRSLSPLITKTEPASKAHEINLSSSGSLQTRTVEFVSITCSLDRNDTHKSLLARPCFREIISSKI